MFDPKSARPRRVPSTADNQLAKILAMTGPIWQLTELVEQVNRIVYGLGFTSGLNPAQWAALRYLARSEREQRTVGAFAQHQFVTAPTASETVSALVRKGFVVRQPSASDKRSHVLTLTEDGQQLLRFDPLLEVATVIERLNEDQRACLGDALGVIARELLQRRRELRERS